MPRTAIRSFLLASIAGQSNWLGRLMSGPTPSGPCQIERVPNLTSLAERTGEAGCDQPIPISGPAVRWLHRQQRARPNHPWVLWA
jgi:hypothetical protein